MKDGRTRLAHKAEHAVDPRDGRGGRRQCALATARPGIFIAD